MLTRFHAALSREFQRSAVQFAFQAIGVLLWISAERVHAQSFISPFSPSVLVNSDAANDSDNDQNVRVAVGLNGRWIAVWEADRNLGGVTNVNNDFDIIYAVSDDDGQHWTAPQWLNPNAATDSGTDERPQIATASQGRWVVVWRSNNLLTGAGTGDFDIHYRYSSDNGATWSNAAKLNDNAQNDSLPGIASNGSLDWLVVWRIAGGSYGSDGDIVVAHGVYNPSNASLSWAPTQDLSVDALSDDAPVIAFSGFDNRWLAVWRHQESANGDYDLFFSFSVDNGATWAALQPLNQDHATDNLNDMEPSIAADGAGRWVAAWRRNVSSSQISPQREIYYSYSSSPLNWSAAAPLHNHTLATSESNTGPAVATDGAGQWAVVWSSAGAILGLGGDPEIVMARGLNSAGSSWADPVVISPADGTLVSDLQPHLVYRPPNGGQPSASWLTAWQSTNNLNGRIGDDYDILFVRSADLLNWSAAMEVNSDASSDGGGDEHVNVATDGQGHWLAVWDASKVFPQDPTSDFDIYVAVSSDNGTTWSWPNGRPWLNHDAETDDANDQYPHIATNGSRWITVWQWTAGGDTDIRYSISDDNGTHWTNANVLHAGYFSSDTGVDTAPFIASDGQNRWMVAWESQGSFGSDYDILFSTSTDNGNTWSTPALLNNYGASDTATDRQVRLAYGGNNRWVAIWRSNADLAGGTNDNDILYSVTDDLGATWSSPARVDSAAASDSDADDSPDITTDRQGRWVTVWKHAATGVDEDILVSSGVNNGGDISWSQGHSLTGNAPTSLTQEDFPRITTDGRQWVVVWRSSQSPADQGGDYEILAARSANAGVSWSKSQAASINNEDDSLPVLATDGAGRWLIVWESDDPTGSVGTDGDIRAARFAIPDCDGDFAPDACVPEPGDMNCDGSVTLADVPLFVQALIDPASFSDCARERADMSRDLREDGADIRLFVEKLLPP